MTKEPNDLSDFVKSKGVRSKELGVIIQKVKHPSPREKNPIMDLTKYLKDGHVAFGVISDTQLNSKHSRLDILSTLYDYFKNNGAAFVVHCGDISDGHMIYENQANDKVCFGFNNIVKHICKVYPDVGLDTYFIGGRDDRSFLKKDEKDGGGHICEKIADRREDLIYLDMFEADIKLAKKTMLKLLHPNIGTKKPYGISYPLQQIINKLEGGTKPDILCLGYYHQLYSTYYRDIHAYLAGTTQNQTPHMRENQIAAKVGGLMLDVHVDKKGVLDYIETTRLPFYK